MIQFFKKIIITHKNKIVTIFFLQAILTILSLFIPNLYSSFLDLLAYSKEKNNIVSLCITICLVTLSNILINYFYTVISLSLKNKISFQLNLALISYLKKVPLEYFNKFNHSYLNQRIKTDSDTISIFFIDNLFHPFFNLISSIYILYMLLNINTTFGFIFITTCAILIILYSLSKSVFYKIRLNLTEKSNFFFDYLNQIFLNEKLIRDTSQYSQITSNINSNFISLYRILSKFNQLDSLFSSTDDFIDLLLTLSVFSIGGIAVINQKITLGEFSIISIYFNILIANLKYFIEFFQSLPGLKVSLTRTKELLDIPIESNGNTKLSNIFSINLKNVNYSFNNNKVFKDPINITFIKNNIYIISGKNGVGKSTLLNIINGTLNNNRSGTIEFNSKNIEELDMYNCRKCNISTCSPIITSTSETVKEYIELYSNLNRITSFLNHQFTNELFNSIVFNIEELLEKKVSELSLGQQQLLSLLLCLSKRSDVYLLDEPTSNLNYTIVINFIIFLKSFSENKIVILITHDRQLLEAFPNIFEIK